MKRLYLKFPTTARFLLAILLGILALVLTGLIHKLLPVPFIDVALLIIATWILYRTDGKSLSAPGLNITIRHFLFLIVGLAIGIVALGLETLLRTLYTGEHWNINSSFNQLALLENPIFSLAFSRGARIDVQGLPFHQNHRGNEYSHCQRDFFHLVHVSSRGR
jgi:hypothetical protein